jgi:hypothetical protein
VDIPRVQVADGADALVLVLDAPAFSRKPGSRGKIHERCCQGLIASSASQRLIVDADASLIACSTTKRCSSERLKRDSGTPWVVGSAHAIALTCATSSGGKTARATRPRPVPQTLKALLAESSPPPADRLAAHPQPRTDLGVRHTVGGHQHQPGPLDLQMRPHVTRRDVLKLSPLGLAQDHLARTAAGHRRNSSPVPSASLQARRDLQRAALSIEAAAISPAMLS